ncbi:hypothetical protein FIV42_01135 [Persicimonas caeni]|uniref:TNFR-Cys domain-containing protein n=1 Tax=Persicimonas caeni TaxID=2292766 RepID=A0A4Y6PMY8_PERCE|nr:hypothetical protein [Persicimonas caeni]QDG49387.1 hypothetical protein FIV42_01135 [Persicimonas caeni]QED30608.1 hypothetical protein FRD00_01130 [Persicimonas caeni]
MKLASIRLVTLVCGFLCALAFSACSSSEEEPECVVDVDCENGQCVDGTCEPIEPADAGASDTSQDVSSDPDTSQEDVGGDACTGDGCSQGDTCETGFHECSGVCVDSTSPQTCGDRCEPCPDHPNATATCTDGACGVECDEGFQWDETAKACVQCTSNVDCTDPAASTCDDRGVCIACTSNDDCSHLDGAGICWEGTCTECSPDDASACGGNSCDPSTGQCTNTQRGSLTACQECVSDSECKVDHACVPMEFKDSPRQKAFCLPVAAPDCARPYPNKVTRQSVNGVSGDFCTINETLTTCEAVTQYGASCADASDCGADGFADGLCEPIDFDTAACTFPCSSDGECPTMSLMGCALGVSQEYCGAY